MQDDVGLAANFKESRQSLSTRLKAEALRLARRLYVNIR